MNPAMINKIKKMQKDMMDAQRGIEEKVFTGTSGGVVEVDALGSKEIKNIRINREAIESLDDLDLLEDVLIAAINDVFDKIDKETQEVMGQFSGGLPGGFGF